MQMRNPLSDLSRLASPFSTRPSSTTSSPQRLKQDVNRPKQPPQRTRDLPVTRQPHEFPTVVYRTLTAPSTHQRGGTIYTIMPTTTVYRVPNYAPPPPQRPKIVSTNVNTPRTSQSCRQPQTTETMSYTQGIICFGLYMFVSFRACLCLFVSWLCTRVFVAALHARLEGRKLDPIRVSQICDSSNGGTLIRSRKTLRVKKEHFVSLQVAFVTN